jgi:tRNA(Ile)-lysidine synthase
MIITDQLFFEKIPKGMSQDSPWVVGLSGGADSLCLTLLSAEYAKQQGLKIIACTIDHKLRPESTTELQPTIRLMQKIGIDHECFVWDHLENLEGNLELKARNARYDLLYKFCKSIGSKELLMGHHALDQWETFFMRLCRGSSVKGLAGIRPLSSYKDIQIVRPLLDFSPEDIRETLKERFSITDYVKDSSNDDAQFERVRWRQAYQELSKKYNLDIENINKAIKRLQRADDCLEQLAKNLTIKVFDGTYIDLDGFRPLHGELKMRVLDLVINKVTPKTRQIVSYSLLKRTAYEICQRDFIATNLAGLVIKKIGDNSLKLSIENR